MRLHLLRHPQPLVARGLCYGSSDLAVAPEVCQQVLAAVTPHLPATAVLYASPLQRCAVLAQALAVQTNTPVRYDARLQEMHFGDWEMRAWDDIDRQQIDAWTANLINYHPGNGESVLQVAKRVRDFLVDLQQDAASQTHSDAIVVCHAGTIRLLMALRDNGGAATLEQAALHAAAHPHAIAYGQLVTLTI